MSVTEEHCVNETTIHTEMKRRLGDDGQFREANAGCWCPSIEGPDGTRDGKELP
jgi:hypothetical protein